MRRQQQGCQVQYFVKIKTSKYRIKAMKKNISLNIV